MGKGLIQGLGHTLIAEKMYSINFTEPYKKFCLSLHCNRANSYLFVNGKEIHEFKAKDSEIVATLLWFGNISKDWIVDDMEKLDCMVMITILMSIFMQFLLVLYHPFINI